MTSIRDLLKYKGSTVWSVEPGTSVLEALKVLADKEIGALPVLQEGQLVGIISERDFVRSIAQTGRCIVDATVAEYMTREIVTIGLDQTTEQCMQMMTDHHIRHLPVIEKGKLERLENTRVLLAAARLETNEHS
ncbi:MAG TPA: CBS domain-containing protein [Anaerolineaceae bacterium]|nr:CBS domain-containing protein [Anaerolineaceae bacterium]